MVNQFQKYSFVFVALSLALFFRLFVISVYKIPTESMAPTFLPGDFIIASQVSYGLKLPWSESVWFKATPQKGDLVVFTFKTKPAISYIKRVAGVEGDEVDTLQGKQKVETGQIYVLSDNPADVDDSRRLGFVPIDRIESQAKLIWFSLSTQNEIRWNRILTQLKR